MKKTCTAHIMTHGHMDIEWYMPLRSFRFWIQEALDRLLETPADEPYALDGQIFPLLSYLECNPEKRERIKAAVKQGRLCVGPFYTQFDEWLPSGEGMIRNCLYGVKLSAEFGEPMRVGYLPDNFGHPGQLPQILRGFGISSLLFMRGMPYITENFPDEFKLTGMDGSCLTAIHFRHGYGRMYGPAFGEANPQFRPPMRIVPYYDGYISYDSLMEVSSIKDPDAFAKDMIAEAKKLSAYFPSGEIPIPIGCDHCPPQLGIAEAIREANRLQDEIVFKAGTFTDYIEAVQKQELLETVHGELLGSRFQYVLLGALSTRSWIKRMHFAAEALLEHYAEPLDTLAFIAGGKDNRSYLDEAWKLMFLNQAHDSIHGSSVDEVHDEMRSRYEGIMQICAGLCHRALEQLGAQTFQDGQEPLLFYTPVRSAYPQYAELWLPVPKDGSAACFVSPERKHLAFQILGRSKPELNEIGLPRNELYPYPDTERALVEVPGQGLQSACLADETGEGDYECDLQTGDNYIENTFLRVQAANGLINITDKRTGRTYYGQNLLIEEEETGDYWDTSPSWIMSEQVLSNRGECRIALTERGPVRAVLTVETVMNVPRSFSKGRRSLERVDIPVSFNVILYRMVPRVDIKVTIDNQAKDHRVSLLVKPFIKTAEVLSRTVFGTIKRPVNRTILADEKLVQPHTRLFPFREYAALEDSEAGFGIAVKGIYDYTPVLDDISGDTALKLTLLRGVGNMARINTKMREGTAAMYPETPGSQCPGVQIFEYAFIPYRTENSMDAQALADAFLYPPTAQRIKPAGGNTLAPNIPWIWDAPNVRFSCFKRSWDGKAYILRLYEAEGKQTDLNLQLSAFSSAALCTMEENRGLQPQRRFPFNEGRITITLKAYEIVSLLLER